MTSTTAAGAGVTGAVILAVIAGTLIWKKRAPRFVAWALLFVGLGAAGVIMSYVGTSLTGLSLYGVGAFTIIGIFCGLVFWFEVVKRDGAHRVRTPLVSLMLGVSLMNVTGTVGSFLRHLGQSSSAQVNKSVSTMFQDGSHNQAPRHGKNHK
jgi:hypothetical protein